MASTGHVQLGTHQGTNLVSQVGRIMNGQNAGRTTNASPRDGCYNEPYFFHALTFAVEAAHPMIYGRMNIFCGAFMMIHLFVSGFI
jgi:hypothetical protein